MTASSLIELRHPSGLALTVSDVGATWLSCRVPLGDGTQREVLLRSARPDDAATRKSYMGATVGRYANRIAHARLLRGGKTIVLSPNPGSAHQLHGGPCGFDRRRWTAVQDDEACATFSLRSADGDQGFPGDLDVAVRYRLGPMTIEMLVSGHVSAPSPVALTNHAYWNLDGAPTDVRDHTLMLRARQYMPVDGDLLPLGALAAVVGTAFDFTAPTSVRRAGPPEDPQLRVAGGHDHAFLLAPECAAMAAPAAQLRSADGGLRLRLHTTLPALQLYTGQQLSGVMGPGGTPYPPFAGLCLEPGFLPDSPNHPEWPQPSCWLMPGDTLDQRTAWHFETGP